MALAFANGLVPVEARQTLGFQHDDKSELDDEIEDDMEDRILTIGMRTQRDP